MDNNFEWLDNGKEDENIIDTENSDPEDQNVTILEIRVQNKPEETEKILPSIWTLQEVLLFGYHLPKKLEQTELERIFNEDLRYLYIILAFVILYIGDIATDLWISIYLFNPYIWPVAIIIIAIIVVPSLISNFTNTKAIWKIKEYERWDIKQRIFWWIQFPFYFTLNFEPIFQYYKNFKNFQSYISIRNGTTRLQVEELIDTDDQILEEYHEGVLNVSKLQWQNACLHVIPQLTLYLMLVDVHHVFNYAVIFFTVSTSMLVTFLSCYEYTRSYYITRGYKINKIFTFCYVLSTVLVIFSRITVIFEMIGAILSHIGELFHNEQAGWFRPAILFTLIFGHWIFETVRWKLYGPEGFTKFLYTFYAGIYRTVVPDISSFSRCVQTNIMFCMQALFFYISSYLIYEPYHWMFYDHFLRNNYIFLGFVMLLYLVNIGLNWYFRKMKAEPVIFDARNIFTVHGGQDT